MSLLINTKSGKEQKLFKRRTVAQNLDSWRNPQDCWKEKGNTLLFRSSPGIRGEMVKITAHAVQWRQNLAFHIDVFSPLQKERSSYLLMTATEKGKSTTHCLPKDRAFAQRAASRIWSDWQLPPQAQKLHPTYSGILMSYVQWFPLVSSGVRGFSLPVRNESWCTGSWLRQHEDGSDCSLRWETPKTAWQE